MNSAEQRAAAYHEASHAVSATLLGATLGNVSLRCEGGTWVGDTQVSWSEGAGPARKQKIFQVAVAGPFGQVKYRACFNWSGSTFDRSDSLLDVIMIIREYKLQEHSRLSFGFVTTDGSKHVLEVRDFNDIGDLEMLASLIQEFDDDKLLQLLGAARDRLNSQAVWAAIGDMAESLCQQQLLSGQEVVAIVHRHGLR
jgi:hypothetical protein